MRKSFLSTLLLLLSATAIFFVSCQKEISDQHDVSNSNSNKAVSEKINAWLDNSKSVKQPNKAANIELLKSNLDYSALRVEKSGQGEQLITVPVKEYFKTLKKIDKNATTYLLLIVDNTGNIRKGNLVLYTPKDGQVNSKMPENAFYKILNTGDPDCKGKFLFLSVSGRKLYQLEYSDGKLHSFSIATTQTKEQAPQTDSYTNSNCIDWYWVTTYYDQYGDIISQTYEYLTTTCEGCDDPDLAMVCPDNGGGSGGGNDVGYEFAVTKPVSWIVAQPQNNWWYVKSYEKLEGQKVGSEPGGGHFTSITHLNSSIFNTESPGLAVWQQLSATPYLFSGSRADCNVTGKVTFPSEPAFPELDVNKTGLWLFPTEF